MLGRRVAAVGRVHEVAHRRCRRARYAALGTDRTPLSELVAPDFGVAGDGSDERVQPEPIACYVRAEVSGLKGATLRDIGRQQCAIASFTIDGLDPRPTVLKLREQAIHIGASDPASTRLDAEARHLPPVFRIAPHYYNTRDEIDRAIAALDALPRG